MRARRACVLAVLVAAGLPATAQTAGPDCTGPAGDPRPDTAEWNQREDDNVACGRQRSDDTSNNPAYAQAQARNVALRGPGVLEDPFRDPDDLNGSRFRHEEVAYTNRAGQRIEGRLFRPCDASCRDRPAGLEAFEPPYPGVVIAHGGGATQEMYHWAAEGLAEAGYMVLTFQVPQDDNRGGGTHYENTKAALDYLLSTPPGELDRDHVGLAGHSAGGVAVSRLGQEDPRISAVVSWDRAQSSTMPAGLRLRTPALFVVADFNCQAVPVCVPRAYSSPPDPKGPGNKDQDFQRLSGAGVDTMKVALRAATHLDFTQFSPVPPSSRHGAAVTFHYTLAWFDRYLKGSTPGHTTLAADALRRLTAATFDGSGDVHNISGGTVDPGTGKNVPARLAGQRVVDRLSFHFRSAYFLRRGRDRCDDIRSGCPAAAGCLARRSPIGARRIGRLRLGLTRGQLARRVPPPRRRTARSWRWCVKGGRGTVGATFSRGRTALVATSAPGHGNRGVRPGRRGRVLGAYPRRRRLARGLFRARPRSPLVFGARGGRMRFVAVASRALAARPAALRRSLRRAGVRK